MNKKILLLLALVAALALVFVACENDATTETDPVTEAPTTEATEAPTEEVTEPTTDEPTEAPTDDATEAPTEETTEAPTEEVTTEEVTEAPTEPPRFNSWDDKSVVAHLSFDQLYTGTGDSSTGTQIFAPGGVAGWDYVADMTEMSEQYLTVWGWIGAVDATFGTFGYAINDAEPVFSADYAVTPEGPVVEAAAAMGGASASRMKIAVDLTGLAGENTVYVLYKDANETVVALATFTVILFEAEPYTVDLTTVGISGSYANLWQGSQLAMPVGDMIVLHYGSVDLGEIDLSQYTKVTVTYATPVGLDANGASFDDQYNLTAQRVLLQSARADVQPNSSFEYLATDDIIITSNHYDMSATNLELTTVEIDLTTVEYNGQVYLSFDFRNPTNNEFGSTSYLLCITEITFS